MVHMHAHTHTQYISLASKLKNLLANGDSIAKVSVEGWKKKWILFEEVVTENIPSSFMSRDIFKLPFQYSEKKIQKNDRKKGNWACGCMHVLCDISGSKAVSLPFTVSNVNSTPDLSYILFLKCDCVKI